MLFAHATLPTMTPLMFVVLGGVVLTLGDFIFKLWIERELSYLSGAYITGMMVYLVGLFFLVESFKGEHMAVASAIFVMVNVATLALLSWWYFGETLSMLQIVGLCLACIAIALLEWGAIKN